LGERGEGGKNRKREVAGEEAIFGRAKSSKKRNARHGADAAN